MKHLTAYIATAVVLWATWHNPQSPPFIPEWVMMLVGPLIFTIPLSLLVHLLTRKIGGPKSRILDLIITLAVVGVYWWLSTDLTAEGLVRSPFRFWLNLTLSSWATAFLPFIATLAIIDAWKSRRKNVVASA